MEQGTLSASDVAMLAGNNDNFGNGWGGMIWLFAILAMMNGGFFGGNNGGGLATQEFVQNGFNFNDLQDQNRDIIGAINSGTAQSVAATNQVFHDIVNNLGDKYNELARDIAGVAVTQQQIVANQNECSSNLSAQIAQNKFDNAMALAGMEQRITSKMDQNEITALRDQVNRLQLEQATGNVVRYPNSWAYNAGPSPFCGCGNGCNI